MEEEKEYFLLDTKKEVESRILSSEDIKDHGKMLLAKVLLLVSITSSLLSISYVISYWGGI